MKKGIVLLITLFFIMAISVLVLKNLDDSNKILDQSDYKLSFSQALILTKNVKNEIAKLLIGKNKEKLEEYIEDGYLDAISFEINNIKIEFSLQEYDKENLNQLNENFEEEENSLKQYLDEHSIYEYSVLQEIYEQSIEDNEKIQSNKQVKSVIDNFIKYTYSNKIKQVEENLGFLNSGEYYSLFIKVSFLNEFLNSYYILNKNAGVEYFETSFK